MCITADMFMFLTPNQPFTFFSTADDKKFGGSKREADSDSDNDRKKKRKR